MNFFKIKLMFVIILCPIVAFAAEDGGHGASVSGFFWRVFIFVVYAALLYWLLNKRVSKGLANSVEVVKHAIEDAEKACADAEKELAEYTNKMAEMNKELESMKLAAKATSEKEKERILKEGEKSAEKMRELAKNYIDTELLKAKNSLKSEIATLVLEEVEKNLTDNIDQTSKQAYIKENIKNIGA